MTSHARPEPLRRRLRFYRALTEAVGHAALQRLRDGPTHPDWPLAYELVMPFLRVSASDYYDFGIALARKRTSPITPSIRRKVQLTQTRLAGLPCEVHSARDAVSPADSRGAASADHAEAPTVLFLHGGGYVTCSPRSHRDVIARIAAGTGARCFAPDYRLAPAHPFPAALDDALACYRALLASGVSPRSLFVAGDSAGGGLSVALTLALRDQGEPLPRGLVLLSPWLDLSVSRADLHELRHPDLMGPESLVANAQQYAGLEPLSELGISPGLADLRGLPPIVMETGEWELLREQNLSFAARARQAGVTVHHTVVPGMLHAFPCFAAILPQGVAALSRVAAFVLAQRSAYETSSSINTRSSTRGKSP